MSIPESVRPTLLGVLAENMAMVCSNAVAGSGLYTACLVFGLGSENQLYVAMAGSEAPQELLIEVLELTLAQLRSNPEVKDA